MMKKILRMATIYFLIDYIAYLNNIGSVNPLYLSVLYPFDFENNIIIIRFLVMNYITIIFISMDIARSFDQIEKLEPYILTRSTRSKAFLIHLKFIIQDALLIIFLKLLSFAFFDILADNFDLMSYINLSFLLLITIIIWSAIYQFMRNIGINTKYILSGMIISLFIIQYFSLIFNCDFLNALVLNVPIYSNYRLYLLKVLILISMIYIGFKTFTNKDFLGGTKND